MNVKYLCFCFLKLASVLHNYYLQTKLIPRTPMSLIPMDEGEKGGKSTDEVCNVALFLAKKQ